MTEIVDRRHAPRKKAYIDNRHDNYTTRKCTYRLIEDGEMVTITVSPKGKRMVTHKATVSQEQFDELWFSEFRHRFESDLNYQRRFKVRLQRNDRGRPPHAKSNGRGPSRPNGRHSNGRSSGGRSSGGRSSGGRSNSQRGDRPYTGGNGRNAPPRHGPNGRSNGNRSRSPQRGDRPYTGFSDRYTSDRGM